MDKGFRDDVEDLTPVIIRRELGLRDLFLYRTLEHGKCIVKGVVEGYREQLSMVEWIDFILDVPALKNNVSYLEKRILSDFIGLTPTPVLYITLTFDSCEHYRQAFRKIDKLKITTSQWFSWDTFPIYAHGKIYDFLNTYSYVLPSSYKPPIYALKIFRGPNIIYYNDYSFIGYRERSIIIPISITREGRDILYPPNYFGVGDDSRKYFFFEFKEVHELDSEDPTVKKYYFLVSKTVKYQGKIVFPIIKVDGPYLKAGVIVKENDRISFYTPIYEAENYVIDFSGKSLGGKKYLIFFKDFWSRFKKKGFSLLINIMFYENRGSPSWLFPELRYGGKIYYSPSSKIGYKILSF